MSCESTNGMIVDGQVHEGEQKHVCEDLSNAVLQLMLTHAACMASHK